MKAYKAFNQDWTCRGFQYEVGKTYTSNKTPKLCHQGFHACTNPTDCFDYYDFTPNTKFAEVELSGKLNGPETGCSKIASSIITITREILWTEVVQLVNLGTANTGIGNSGNWNSSNRNSGNWNSGNQNSGDRNSGNQNSGDRNSGNQNSGRQNSGEWNLGNWNSGNSNLGNWNSGDWNSGNWNSGDWNSGDWNSGDWNSGHRNSGYFNTKTPTNILAFNKPCSKIDWELAKKPGFLYFHTTQWIDLSAMTEEELKKHPMAKTTQGYLKTLTYKEAWRHSWNAAPDTDKQLLYKLPNFDPKIFEVISGIDVTQDPTWPPE